MYGEEKCAVGGKKALHFLPVPGNVVPLHPQTRGDRLFRDGRDSVALPWGARSLRDLHRQEIVVQETSTSEPSISFHKDRDKSSPGHASLERQTVGLRFSCPRKRSAVNADFLRIFYDEEFDPGSG